MLWKSVLFWGALSPVLTIMEWANVRELSYAIADKLLCRCIVIMFPSNTPFDINLMEFGRTLAHGEKQKPPLTAYNFGSIFEGNLQSCYNPLYIAVENSVTRSDLETLSKKYSFRHSIWVVISEDEKSAEFFENVTLTVGSNLFSVSSRFQSVLVIHEVIRVAPGFPVRMHRVGLWDLEHGLTVVADSAYKQHSDMEGFLWRVGTMENWPMTSFVLGEAGSKLRLDGFFARIWLELEAILNFTSVFVPAVDGSSGRHLSDDTWNGLCGMLVRGEIDVILSEFSMSTERQSIIESLLPLLHAKLNVFYLPDGVSWNWDAILRPFDLTVWIAILVWLIVSTVSLVFMSWVARKCGLMIQNTKFSGNNGFFALQTLCQQGVPEAPSFWGGRILFITCYLTAAVFFPCYSASLISSLTHRIPFKPFDSLQEMLQAKYPIIILDNMVEYEFFDRSKDPVMKQVLKELIYKLPVGADQELSVYKIGYTEMCTKRVAFFAADSVIEAQLDGYIKNCAPVKFSQAIADIHQAIGLPKNSLYREVLNSNILRLREFGIIHRLHLQYMGKVHAEPSTLNRAVDFNDILEILIFLGVAIFLSIMVLIAEVVIHGKSVKQRCHC